VKRVLAARLSGSRDAGRLNTEAGGVDEVIAREHKAVAMEGICAGTGDSVHHPSGMHAFVPAQNGGFLAELGDGIGERIGEVAAGHIVAVVGAIETPQGGVTHAAGD